MFGDNSVDDGCSFGIEVTLTLAMVSVLVGKILELWSKYGGDATISRTTVG